VFQLKEYLEDLDRLDSLIKSTLVQLDEGSRDKVLAQLKKIDWEFIRKDMVDIIQSCLEGSIRVKDIVLGLKIFPDPTKDLWNCAIFILVLKTQQNYYQAKLKTKLN
jgi:hypothetical protein